MSGTFDSQLGRRDFLKAGAVAGGLALAGEARPAGRPAEKRPNVLFLMCDQLNASVLGCYGGPVATPHIDRIAREGVRFDQAVCPTPFCSPTRASIVLGVYPHAHGIVSNCSPTSLVQGGQEGLHGEDETTEKLLHAAGYATHHYGKWHLKGDDLPYYPDMFEPERRYVREMDEVFRKVRQTPRDGWMQWYSWALPVERSPEFRQAVAALGDRWGKEKFAEFITKIGRLTLPLEQNYEVRVADLTVERIKALADRPFMITASFNGPHDPNVVPSPYYERFDPAKITPPVNAAFREKRFEGDWGRRVVADLGEPGLREFLRIYHATVKMIDDQVGRILAALDAAGLTDDTVIVFTADHGDMAGGHGMVWKSTGAFYDEIVRVPLLIRYPRRFRPQVSDLAADLTDLRPTLLGLTALKAPGAAHGQDLAPFLDGRRPAPQARAFAFSERVGGNTKLTRQIGPRAKGSFMLRGQGWKYVRYAGGEEFLYHLTEDPGEMKNLAGDPKCDARRKELAGKMDAWLARTGWPGGPA